MRYYKKAKEDLKNDIIKNQKKNENSELSKNKNNPRPKSDTIKNYEDELTTLKKNLILSETEKQKIVSKIKELLNHTEKFESKYNKILKNINDLEKEIYRAQSSLKEINEKQNFFDRRILFIQKFSVLNQIFKIEITENSKNKRA